MLNSLTLWKICMEKIKFNENEIIIKLGDTSEYAYVILDGEVGVYILDNFDEKPNFVLGKNEVFGELGILNNQLRTSNVKSITQVELLKVSKKEMNKIQNIRETDISLRLQNPSDYLYYYGYYSYHQCPYKFFF